MRLLVAALLVASPALAAHVTDVADAADERHPLEVDLDATFQHSYQSTRINREQAGASGISLEDELQHNRTVDAVLLRMNIGIWHDLELHAFAPWFVRDAQEWSLIGGTLQSNANDASGKACSPCSKIAQDGKSTRRGLGDPTFGVAWGPVNEERELRLKPELFPEGKAVSTWVIGFDYTLPLSGTVDTPGGTGPELRKAHVFTLWTAFSKRYRVLEPYARISGSAPVATSSAYDNCSGPSTGLGAPGNCGTGSWKGQTGYKPAYQAGLTIGAELVAAEDPKGDQRLAFDVRGDLRYHGPGRDYTQVTDALGKLTYQDEYLTGLASLGLYGRLARWFHLRVYGTIGADTPHFLTDEDSGATNNSNPAFDYRLDLPGRRLHAEAALIWSVSGSLALNF